MYELIILSHLVRRPSHGYLIAKIINDIIGPYAKISNGRFYPLLAKLEREGYIETHSEPAHEQHGDRHARQYTITVKGRQRQHELMMDTSSNPGEYSRLFLQKVFSFDLLEPEERLYLIDHYINYCQAHVLHQRAEQEDMLRNGLDYGLKSILITAITNAQQHLRQQWQLEMDWAVELRQQAISTSGQSVSLPGFSKN